MMFSPEYYESKVYSLNRREQISSFSAMWAYCTSIVDSDYPEVFPEAVQNKLGKALSFNFIRQQLLAPQTAERFVYAWHNDGEVIRAGITTDIAYVYLENYLEKERAEVEIGLPASTFERINGMFNMSSPSDILIDQIYYDVDGNYAGLSVNPTKVSDTFLVGTPLRNLIDLMDEDETTSYDFDLLDDKIVLRPRKNYNLFQYKLPADVRGEERVLDYGKFKPVKVKIDKRLTVGYYIDKIRDAWEVFSDQDVQYVTGLIDHPEQEINIELIYNMDGTLDDIWVYKVEVRDFKVWRS